ncbi:EAL domain-containing protein [Moritella sp. 36]|uniref:EAL domain-containing protein n=1 Tax=Moritella sp. 36 TaxID=2746233 RepID=UPI001BA4A148|nr:EAL domain-containing protein [Moritella sp. 36]QUM88119.1 EAL domain-containing protein [Moritella sp. 36]
MSYIKIQNHNSVTIKNINNNSSADFTLLTQSIINPKNKQVFALEVTTSFNHNSKKNINTEEFFKTISDDFVKELILIQIEELNMCEYKLNSERIIASINCPFSLLFDSVFVKEVVSLSKVRFAFEICNFKSNTITDSAKRSIRILKSQGHELWLDNFMSEEIPIDALHILRWDRVKIDRTFIYKHMNNHSIVSALYHFVSKNSFKNLIFEGIESDYQHDQIAKLDCLCQGFLYCKPFSLENIQDQQFEAHLAYQYG